MGISNPTADGTTAGTAPQASSARFDEAEAYAQQQREEAAAAAAAGCSAGATSATPAAGPDPLAAKSAAAPSQPAAAPSQAQQQHQAQPQTHQQQPQQQQGRPPLGQSFTEPVQGVPIRGPTATPAPAHVIIGYQLIRADESCSCDLTLEGWLCVFVLLLVFPFIAWIPCVIPDCYQTYQVPIYGPPGSQPVGLGVPVAYVY